MKKEKDQKVKTGGLLSVALSLISRSMDVIHHCILWSPDFPHESQRCFRNITNPKYELLFFENGLASHAII